MQRAFFRMKLNPGCEEHYDRNHRAVWPTVLEAIERCGVREYSIFRDGLELFFYIETENFLESMRILNSDPEHTRWGETYAFMFESTANPTTDASGAGLIPEVFRFEAGP